MTVVFLHGINNTSASWAGVRARMPRGVTTLAPELPALPDVDAIAAHLLEDLPQRAMLVGHSFGGYVALALLAMAPGRVAGIAMVNSQDGADSAEMAATRLTLAEAAEAGRYLELATAAGEKSFHPANLSRPEIRAIRASELAGYGGERYAAHQRACAIRPDRRALLADFAGPKLVLTAADDAVIPARTQTAMAQAVGARQVIVPTAGHMLPVEDAAAVAEALAGWLG